VLIGTGCAAPGCAAPEQSRPTFESLRAEGVEEAPLTFFAWSGAVTPTSATVVVRTYEPHQEVRLLVSADDGYDDPIPTQPQATTLRGNRIARFRLVGLEPDTEYRYAVAVDSIRDTRQGRFLTPPDRPFSFRIAAGACASTGSDHPVFDRIREADPFVFFHIGDFHYEDISRNATALFQEAYNRVLSSPEQQRLYQHAPIMYVWDDHDYGPNDSNRRSRARIAAGRTYRQYVPHHPLAVGRELPGSFPGGVGGPDDQVPIYRAFTLGRLRVIVTDSRSLRTPGSVPDSPAKTMLGARQKAWLFNELEAAAEEYPLILWVQTVPWISSPRSTGDNWGAYHTERREIADFIASRGIQDKLLMLSGDSHMIGADDGSHSGYATIEAEDQGGFPVLHAAALDRQGSVKGGPYSEGAYGNRSRLIRFGDNDGQFGVLEIEDEGDDEICARYEGIRVPYNDTDETDVLVDWDECFPAEPWADPDSTNFFEELFD
jgi:alkaline phosphatase D